MKRRSAEELNQAGIPFKVTQEGNKWIGFRICPECKKEIKHSADKKCYLLRNIRNLINKPCASCNKKGENNHFFGKKHTEETKSIQSENRKNKGCGDRNPMSKKENREKLSKTIQERYDSGKFDFLRKIQSNTAKRSQALGLLKYAPISVPEKELRKILEEAGFSVIPQYPIGSLHYDLLVKEKNLLIEYNGDYWHCNPKNYSHDYLNKKKNMTAEQLWEQDENKKSVAISNDFKFIVIWESDYKQNKEVEIRKILNIE